MDRSEVIGKTQGCNEYIAHLLQMCLVGLTLL